MSFADCNEAVAYFLSNGKSERISTDNKDVKCATTASVCMISGNTDEYIACLKDPLTEPTTVFNYMHGKISPVKFKKSGRNR